MWNQYQPFYRRIRLFPHIIPIAFPIIFPIGLVIALIAFRLAIGLLSLLFHLLFPVAMLALLVLLALFVFRTITLGSPAAAWNSMLSTGQRWQQHFTSARQQAPYDRPQTPYYQPSQQASQRPGATPEGQVYSNDYYRPTPQTHSADQPQAQYPEQMPPMQH